MKVKLQNFIGEWVEKERHNKLFAFRVPCGDGRFVLVSIKLEEVK